MASDVGPKVTGPILKPVGKDQVFCTACGALNKRKKSILYQGCKFCNERLPIAGRAVAEKAPKPPKSEPIMRLTKQGVLNLEKAVWKQTHKNRSSYNSKWFRTKNKFLKTKVVDDLYQCDPSNGHGCGRMFSREYITVDHIIKRSVRPDLVFEPSNFQVLCQPCHYKKDWGMVVK